MRYGRILVDKDVNLRYPVFMMNRIFLLTVLLGLASPAWGQYYDNSCPSCQQGIQQEQQAMQQQQYEQQMQQQAQQQQQMQQQLDQQQQQINSYNNASGMERLTGNSYNGPLGR